MQFKFIKSQAQQCMKPAPNLPLVKLQFSAPKGYTIGLQIRRKNGYAFNASKKNQPANCVLKIFWLD
ncbi:unnamed protein product [Trifolium pratense]|uniref:Uncharacterized protein n=2 Tax=Trifolium pratense TaxID=57577 RepID=A0ACB0JQ82_TRIPR|nr:unnamed protein product [Trifolium pratense]CAJ2645575.1 unnamed protein product [Trifolium pratense]